MDVPDTLEQRVLILAPTGRDGSMTRRILEDAGVVSEICDDLQQLCDEARRGCGAIILTDEALTPETTQVLISFLEAQPLWSDVPIIVFPSSNASATMLQQTLGTRTNATVMARPISASILTSVVVSSLRARRRQYQTRNLLEQLEEADRHKDLFLATLSHELRTPLTAMVGWVRLLRKGNLDEETAARALEVIDRSASAQTRMIQDILSVSRIITGKFQIEMEAVDLMSAIQAAIDSIRPTATARNVRIETTFECDTAMVMGDSVRLQQIVWNLLSNALKFTPVQGSIAIRVQRKGGSVSVSVQDSGEGIAAEFLPHVFDRFRQADDSYTRKTGGLGLGLAIVRHLVELHGGSVQAKSEGLGQGSTFTVSIPVLAASSEARGSSACENADSDNDFGDLTGVDVILVEDDLDSREMLVTLLQSCGAEVRAAGNAAEALEMFQMKRPHVVASDIGMPDVDGFELMRRIRSAEGRHPPVPAIALTGFATGDDAKKALFAGYQRHIAKPVRPEELIRTIGELVRPRLSMKLKDTG